MVDEVVPLVGPAEPDRLARRGPPDRVREHSELAVGLALAGAVGGREPEADRIEPVGAIAGGEPFDGGFGHAVDADRRPRGVLAEGLVGRVAVDAGDRPEDGLRRREHDADPGGGGRLEHGERAADVDRDGPSGVTPAGVGQQRGEVDDGVRASHGPPDGLVVRDVSLEIVHPLGVGRVEVEHGHLVSGVRKGLGHERADRPAAARDEDAHRPRFVPAGHNDGWTGAEPATGIRGAR